MGADWMKAVHRKAEGHKNVSSPLCIEGSSRAEIHRSMAILVSYLAIATSGPKPCLHPIFILCSLFPEMSTFQTVFGLSVGGTLPQRSLSCQR